MRLCARQMQGIRRAQVELGAQAHSHQVHRLIELEGLESLEELLIVALQDGVRPLERADQAFQLDQRRNREALRPGPCQLAADRRSRRG